MSNLGKIFSSGVVNDIQVLFDDVQNSGVLDPVGTSAFTVQQLKVAASNPSLKVFDLAANVDASANAQASIAAAGVQITPYDASAPLDAPTGSSWAQLQVTGGLNAGVSGNTTQVPLTVSASAAASFTYQHFIPAAATETRLVALGRLVSTAQLPQFESLTTLRPGEVSRLEAPLNFELGIKAKYGSSFDLAGTLDLFAGLSAQLKAQVQYSIEGSLGWSIFDDMTMVVGSAQQNNPGWARVRIQRTHRDSFTAGATFALQVNYDVSSLADALQKAFEMTPLPRVISILETAATIDFATLQTKVTDAASNEVIELIAGTGWKTKAANDPTIVKALADINKVVSIYNSVDDKVKQLWSALLTRVNLQPGSELRTTIEQIAALDPKNPNITQFLSPAAVKALDLLESLSGKSVEQLLTGSSAAVETAIATAVNLAKQLMRVINDTPTEINGAIDQFSEKFGIKSAITFLAANATSLDQIEAFGDNIIKKVIAKAVGIAFDKIGQAQFDTVQAWAKKILAQWEALSAKLAAAAKFLKGQIGFSVALEFSRVSEFSALLDFEVNPQDASAAAAVQKQLPAGSVSGMLATLNDLKKDNGPAVFEIREAIIVSRHLRTGATTVILSILGLKNLQSVTATQFDESVLRVTSAGRNGTYSGGFVQAVNVGATAECSAWIAADAIDDQIAADLPFDTVSRSLHLTFAHRSEASTADERAALRDLLGQLGFIPSTGAALLDAADGAKTSFAMNVVLDDAAVAAFVGDTDESKWNSDFRNAGNRVLDDRLIDNRRLFNNGPRISEIEASVVRTDLWTDTWTDSSTMKFRSDARTKMIAISGTGKTADILGGAVNAIIPPYLDLAGLIIRRPKGLQRLGGLRDAVNASASRTPASLRKLSVVAAGTLSNTSLVEAQNPMFTFWFVVARLCRLGPAVLANAKGVATFRVAAADGTVGAPTEWTLTPSVGVPAPAIAAAHLFPF